MPHSGIRAVIFDMGGTLEDLYYDEAVWREATRQLQHLLGQHGLDPGLDADGLQSAVVAGMAAYQAWREATEIELPPERVWAEYVFPHNGLPKERLAGAAEELTYFYETHYQIRKLRPEARGVLTALNERGFRLGVISNIISRTVVPRQLAAYGIAHLLDPVLTSAAFGWRKPNPRIFLEAARLLGLPPAQCAYVGDTVSRDVIGARRAGYGLAVQIRSFLTDKADRGTEDALPDAVIHSLTDILPLVTSHSETVHGD
ncbi:MAG: hypothetical protein Kow00123_20710 [Anaerolineales bacterium]